MIAAPIPKNEKKRLENLLRLGMLDSPTEKNFNKLVQLAASICKVPIALITFIDSERQWFKARVGIDISETPRPVSFCAHTILGIDLMEVQNTLDDERFHDNPFVLQAPNMRFYAGMPLISSGGMALGSLCVVDLQPRQLTTEQRFALQVLAQQVVNQIESDFKSRQLREIERQIGQDYLPILDKIRYSDLIQKTLTPRHQLLKEQFPESFILWKPRDIIVNNFAFVKKENDYLFIGIIDYMSLKYINPFFGTLILDYLNKIIEQGNSHTGKILDLLHKNLSLNFDQKNSLTHLGISVALCRIDKKKGTLGFSGAEQLLYMVAKSGEIKYLKGNQLRLGEKQQDKNSPAYEEQIHPIGDETAFFLLGEEMQSLIKSQEIGGLRQIIKALRNMPEDASIQNYPSALLSLLNRWSNKSGDKGVDLLAVGFKA